MVLDYIALAIMVLLVGVLVFAVVKLGALPGKIAESRSHPQADAIRVCGWLGLILGVLWLVALVWAYTKPLEVACSGGGLADGDAAASSSESEEPECPPGDESDSGALDGKEDSAA